MSRKHQPMNLGYFISQIMQKARHPFYPIKSNLTITFLIHTLGFKAFSIDQKQSLRAPQVQYKRPQSDSKSKNHVLPTYLKLQSKSLFIPKLGGGNMGTGEPSLSSSQSLSISSSWWLWVEVSNLLLRLSTGRFGLGLCPTQNRPDGIGFWKILPASDC